MKWNQSLAVIALLSCSQIVHASDFDYVLVNAQKYPQYFLIFNPGTSSGDAETGQPTHTYELPRCSAYIVDQQYINYGADAAVYTARPVGASVTKTVSRSDTSSLTLTGEVTGEVKRGSAKADAEVTAEYNQTHSLSDDLVMVFDKAPVPFPEALDVNHHWVQYDADNATDFAKARKLTQDYVIYASANQSSPCTNVYHDGTGFSYSKNFEYY